jgi:Ca-activated chloride channel family protein
MDRAFDQILKDLRTQYLIGYYPKDVPLTANRFHTLEVSVDPASLRVTTRNGYYGEALREGPTPQSSNPSPRITVAPGDESLRAPKKPVPATKGKTPQQKGQ